MFEELKAARQLLLNNLFAQDTINVDQKTAIEQGDLSVLDVIDFSYNVEQKDFLIALNELEKFPSVQGLNAIVENYISEEAGQQININASLRTEIVKAANELSKEAYTQSLGEMRQKIETLSKVVNEIPERSGMFSGRFGGQNTTLKDLVDSVAQIKSALEVNTTEGVEDDSFPKAADVSEDSFTQFNPYDKHYRSSCANRYLERSIDTIESSFDKSEGKAKYNQAKQQFTSFKEGFDKFTSAKDALVEHAEEFKKKTGHHVDNDLDKPGKQSFVDDVLEERKEAQGKEKGQER